MSVFCLIHGSTQSSAGWELLIRQFDQDGHYAFTVELPVDEPDAGVGRYVDIIAAQIRAAEPTNVITVAHSLSGIFLPLLAERCRIRRLVFLAAVVPEFGMSVLDQVAADPGMMNPAWVGKNPADDFVAREFLFHDCAPDVAAWALTTRRLLVARGALAEKCPLIAWPDVPVSSIVCADDRTISPSWSRRVARERLGVDPIGLPGGHCPHVSRPAALAKVLAALAG